MVTYKDITFEDISEIKHLWESNRLYHEEISEYFTSAYRGLIFEERIAKFSAYETENILITIAYDEDKAVGYCLSTKEHPAGEVETLHVLPEYRGKKIGKELMKKHLDWLEDSGCAQIKVVVSQENEKTINFYRSLGFYPSTIEMHKI